MAEIEEINASTLWRTQPYTTILGIDAHGRRFWVPIMMKDIAKNNITAVQAIRNLLMASTLMATTSILLCAGLGAVISSTYSVKKPINDTVFGANGELIVALKYATILAVFILSFTCHTLSIRFLNQINILISTPQDGVNCMVTPEFLTLLLEKASILNVVGNRQIQGQRNNGFQLAAFYPKVHTTIISQTRWSEAAKHTSKRVNVKTREIFAAKKEATRRKDAVESAAAVQNIGFASLFSNPQLKRETLAGSAGNSGNEELLGSAS
ncbi:uncharacterized protein G2W53_034349 [Senna tora]|uniref:Uncharacterized protein n=1 Tax=Senna tora TaxID=362788 RepID=A0A834T186_9FABA|nr:uncharacterized protein G2W53_034349 [Senna tora]